MNRQFLAATALSTSFSGCATRNPETPPAAGGAEGTSSTKSEIPTTASAQTSSPAPTATDDCQWPDMCEGSQIVVVEVNWEFSGDVTLEADCRGEAFAVESGESLLVERERDAESCRMRLFVAGEAAYDEDVPGYKRVTLTVGPDGEVDVEAVVH